ncbi:MAG: copper amine oxidase N-terminal domain-containing protein [Defluviitaleaceae bacterium]|nr:copper amine oxidase N-terminal domain-containing protein [Defluviitaleaceae bacterium]
MKKFLYLGLIVLIVAAFAFSNIGAVLAAQVWNVVVSTASFVVNGETREINALNINGRNYVSVAEISDLLNIDVSFDEATNTVYLAEAEPIRTVDVTNTLSERNIIYVIEIDIPKLYPQQHIVLDDMFSLNHGDIVTYDISFGDIRNGVMVGFVENTTWSAGDAIFWGMLLDSLSSVERGRMYFETPIGIRFSLNEAHLIVRNQHPINSNEITGNIRGTITISR